LTATPKPTEQHTAYHILTIYWFLFIYFSLAAMDEMIELFSVLNQMEKGALGLFFELNYLIGIFLTGYIGWFITHFKSTDIAPAKGTETGQAADFANMYNWLYFHFIYIFVSLFIIIVVNFIYRSMDNKAKSLKPDKAHKVDDDAAGSSVALN
jgi:hypothetical protein